MASPTSGLYLSRQGATITWPVGAFLHRLDATKPLPPTLRDQLRQHLAGIQAARSVQSHGSPQR
jgi:hypothetical protein